MKDGTKPKVNLIEEMGLLYVKYDEALIKLNHIAASTPKMLLENNPR